MAAQACERNVNGRRGIQFALIVCAVSALSAGIALAFCDYSLHSPWTDWTGFVVPVFLTGSFGSGVCFSLAARETFGQSGGRAAGLTITGALTAPLAVIGFFAFQFVECFSPRLPTFCASQSHTVASFVVIAGSLTSCVVGLLTAGFIEGRRRRVS